MSESPRTPSPPRGRSMSRDTPPGTPATPAMKIRRLRPSSPSTPVMNMANVTPYMPSAPSRQRHMRASSQRPPEIGQLRTLTEFNVSVTRNLSAAFNKEAELQAEADEFHQEQDGEEQQVPEMDFPLECLTMTFSWLYGEEYEDPEDGEFEDDA